MQIPTRSRTPAFTPALVGLLALVLLPLGLAACSGPDRPRPLATHPAATTDPAEPPPRATTFSVVTDEPSRYDYTVPTRPAAPAPKPSKPAPIAAAPVRPVEASAPIPAPAPTPIAASPTPIPPAPPQPTEPPAAPEPLRPTNTTTILVEVHPSDRAINSGKLTARLGGGGAAPIELPATLWLVYPDGVLPATPAADPIADRVARWLGPQLHYRAVRATTTDRPATLPASSGWFAQLAIPNDSTAIQAFVDGEPIALPPPPRRSLPSVPHAGTTAARAALSILGADPRAHWRAALATPDPIAPLPSDPIIRAAVQRGSLAARAALATLDADLARRTALRLAGVVDLGDGVSLPIWPGDAAPARDLIEQLLSPAAAPARKALAAEAWLAQQPTAGAIVIDDAAAIDPRSGITLPSILLVNFNDQPAAASATRAEVPPLDLLRIEPMTALTATIGADRRPEDAGAPPLRTDPRRLDADRHTLADIRIGQWTAKRAVVGEIAKVRPPGLAIGSEHSPLMADWTQSSFLAAATDPTSRSPMPESPMARSLSGRLYRSADAGGKWMLYFEIAAAAASSEMVLYFGPRNGATSTALQVKPDGTLTEIRAGKAAPAGKATLTRATDRNALFIPLPASAIEAGHIVRIGLIVIDPEGRRASWPRPMLPWHTEPGRIAIDLDSWALP